ncbi:filamentous hemagglutinin N-terminal domain-containing protein [Pseudomonas sp. TH03]|uniref:two-partner secretion domain-containing protein n=1 Tax=Pseudomonas sp. TH03 TaxID=2796369 RepID=UPI001911E00A|nr:YDG domain-containing protein [Pseudomonas sp. TH03]MBK5550149.1 filamentous hemagglutinin N-terminal domain-containing protein [Pseudomonas sp. TH03]
MNAKLYRHIFSKSQGCLVVVSEIARGHGKGSTRGLKLGPLSLAVALAIAPDAYAGTLPTGGAIVGGQGQIGTAGSTLTVQQNTQKLAVNWDSFSIGAGDKVVFNQPSSKSVALNSVLGNNPSQIYGQLKANGQVFLINPNGVLFGKSAQVSVGGLFASTLPINTSSFMNSSGNYSFDGGAGPQGDVVNQGNLRAVNGGFVVLAANKVVNTGTISATRGTVALAAGSSVTLALDNAGLATVKVDGAALGALIQNQGIIEADGGRVLLTARGRDMLQSSVMNLSGVIQANTIGTKNGQIVIDGGNAALGDSGTVALNNSTLNTLGAKPGEQGGTVSITGPAINLQGATINVSGDAGGGSVVVGGGARGTGALTHALTTTMDASSKIDASATGSGNGGSVVLWSDEKTVMDGAILAHGGQLGGNGGSVETSSKGKLGVQGSVSASAPRGKAGTWLLDPTDITVSSTPNATGTGTLTVNNGSLGSSLLGGTNVVLDASQGAGGTGFINVTAPISSTGSGNLTLLSANGQNVTLGSSISLGTGSLTAIGGDSTTAGQNGGSVVLNAGNAISAANVTLTGGNALTAGVNGANSGGNGGAGQAGGAGGSVFLNGLVSASATGAFTGGVGAQGGGGGGGGYGSTGGTGGAGGAGGSILVNANVSAATVDFTMGAGGNAGGAGGAGVPSGSASAYGGKGGAGGAGGALILGNATVAAVGSINVVGAIGGGAGGGGQGESGQGRLQGGPGTPGTATTGGKGGSGGGGGGYYGFSTVGGTGGAQGTNYGAGSGAGAGNYNAIGGGAGGAAGTVYVNGKGFLTGGNVTFTSPTPIVINGDLTINVTGTPTIANQISGLGNFTQAGSGTTTLTGANTYTGATNVQAGHLVLSDAALQPTAKINANVTQQLYTRALNVSAGAKLTLNMGATNFTLNTGTQITGAGTLVKAGTGMMLMGNNANTTTVNMTGLFDVASGTVSNDYANVDWSNNTGTLQVDAGALFDLRKNNVTVGALTGSGTVQNSFGSNTLTVGAGNGSGTFAGVIAATPVGGLPSSGAKQVNVVKTGTGTQTLTGANTYSGTTLISAGTLAVGNGGTTGKLGTGAVTDNANLVINYSSAVNLSAVASNAAGITGSGNLTAISGGALGIDRAINLTAGNGSILLEAGAATAAGTASGGDVTASANIATGTGGTITVFSGNPNTATLMANMTGANGATAYKTYNANAGAVVGATAGTRNFYYRAQPSATLAALSKVYDGTNNAGTAGSTLSLVGVDGDATNSLSTLSPGATYNTTHAGTGLTVTATPTGNMTYVNNGQTWAVSGYSQSPLTASNPNINITPAAVSVTAAPQTKTYDGTTASNQPVSNVTGLVSGDSLTGLSQAYNNSHVLGTNGSLLAVDSSLAGVSGNHSSLLSDYAIDYHTNTGTITPAAVAVTAATQTKVFDGTTLSTAPVSNITGLVNGDSLTGLTQAYNNSHVQGTDGSLLTVDNSGAAVSGNHSSALSDYAIDYHTNTGTITPAPVSVTAATQSKTYDGTTASNQAVSNVTGLMNGDSLGGLTQAYNNSHVLGANGSLLSVNGSGAALTSSQGNTLNDYDVSYINTLGTIIPRILNIDLNNISKVYDGTDLATANGGVAAPATANTGLVAGESLTSITGNGNYNSAHVLDANAANFAPANMTVGLSGNNAADYSIALGQPISASITPAAVAVTAATQTKVFDGTTLSTAPVSNITGLVNGDSLTGLTQAYNNSHVQGTDGSLLTVDNSGAAVSGNHSSALSDYAIDYHTNTGTITPAPVSVTAATQSKTYDGTTASNQTVSNVTGLMNGDTLGGLTQTYNNSHVLGANGSLLSVNGSGAALTSSQGNTLNDYAVSYINTLGTIIPRILNIDLNNISKVYDGTDLATANGGVAAPATANTGLVAGESLTSITGNGNYNSAHVLDANAANFALANMTVGLSGDNAADYSIALVQPVTASITPAAVAVTAATQTRAFDGTTASTAPITSITGLVSGDNLTGLSQSYDSSQALGVNGSTLLVNSSGAGVSGQYGSALSDYAVSYFSAPGTITPARVSGSNADAFKRQGAVYAAQHMATVSPPVWITVTQSPESSQMLEVANTGERPTMGPTTIGVTPPSKSLHCLKGAIRPPEGVAALPVNDCI